MKRDLEYIQPISPHLLCSICNHVLEQPVQTTCCQQLFCRVCLFRSLEEAPRCPFDRQPTQIADVVDAPKAVLHLLDELAIFCPYREYGCQEHLLRRDLVAHLEICLYHSAGSSYHASSFRACVLRRELYQTKDEYENVAIDCIACGQTFMQQYIEVNQSFIRAINSNSDEFE
jgi:hypothetical protein